jgi:hypothetical protein
MTPPLGSVTRPVRVAVGPARRDSVARVVARTIRNSSKPVRVCTIFHLRNFADSPEYAAGMVVLYQGSFREIRKRIGTMRLVIEEVYG